jgi:hypothetical protein
MWLKADRDTVERATRQNAFARSLKRSVVVPEDLPAQVDRLLSRRVVLSLKRECATVFLSSHVLADIESTADRVAILKNGTILQCGNLNDILAADGRRIEIDFEMRAGAELDRIAQRMDGFHETGAGWTGHVDDAEQASRIVGNVLDAGGRLVRYQRRRASLEEFFVRQVSDAFPRPVGAPSDPRTTSPSASSSASRSNAPSSSPGPSIHHRTPSGTSLDRVEEDAPR